MRFPSTIEPSCANKINASDSRQCGKIEAFGATTKWKWIAKQCYAMEREAQ